MFDRQKPLSIPRHGAEGFIERENVAGMMEVPRPTDHVDDEVISLEAAEAAMIGAKMLTAEVDELGHAVMGLLRAHGR